MTREGERDRERAIARCIAHAVFSGQQSGRL
jgi:hypothetical protein